MGRNKLVRRGEGSLVAGGRTFALPHSVEDALTLLAASDNPPVLDSREARRAAGSDPFIVTHSAGFTLYKPWRHRQLREVPEDVAVGPAVAGHLVPTPYGCRLDVRVRKYLASPSQYPTLMGTALAYTLLFAVLLVGAGPHPIILGIAALIAVSHTASIFCYAREQRKHDIRQLLAIVERTFGPHELPARDDAPHRRTTS